jgi:hypothetical protein
MRREVAFVTSQVARTFFMETPTTVGSLAESAEMVVNADMTKCFYARTATQDMRCSGSRLENNLVENNLYQPEMYALRARDRQTNWMRSEPVPRRPTVVRSEDCTTQIRYIYEASRSSLLIASLRCAQGAEFQFSCGVLRWSRCAQRKDRVPRSRCRSDTRSSPIPRCNRFDGGGVVS